MIRSESISCKTKWIFFLYGAIVSVPPVMGQNVQRTNPDPEELLLSFSYPSVGRVFVLGQYDYLNQRMYVPVMEMFNLLGIYIESNNGLGMVAGTYLIDGESYKIDFRNYTVKVGYKEKHYSADLMFELPLDSYIAVEVFEEMFEMVFTYSLNNLSLSLETRHVMPVVDKSQREAARQRIEKMNLSRSFYPLEYGRERSVLRAGFLDYNLGIASQMETLQQDYNFQFVGGIEALGGEVRARNSFGYSTIDGWFNRYGNISWKYSVRDLPAFSSVQVGQISTRGLQSQQINGVAITNNPIEPRRLYGETFIDGSTKPDSEVELYRNNELIDFTVSDAQGYYRFNLPLRYGTTRLRTQVYTSDGQLKVNEKEIQVPFTFLPKGKVTYNVQAGMMENDGTIQNYEETAAANGDITYGLSNWLTTKVGVEYNDVDLQRPAVYGSASARIFQQYLVNMEFVPSAFYQAQSSVVFNSNHSIAAAYTYFDGHSRFNTKGAEHQLITNIYTPFPFSFLNAGIRVSADYNKLSTFSETRLRTDLFSQIGPINLRFNYTDRLIKNDSDIQLTGGILTGAVTYRLTRRSGLKVLAGSFLRGSAIYNRLSESIQQVDVQFSKTVFDNGQFSLGFSRAIPSGQSFLQVGFSVNLGGKVRSSTSGRTNFGNSSLNQNLRGSVGFDDRFNDWQTIDRQQVGKAGASVVLFIDNDNDGRYTQDKDEIIPYPAVKLNRSAQVKVTKNGVVRLSQLQSNFRYNMEIDRGEIPNPLFMPIKDKFSFIADPNQFKTIEVPFYQSGVIEGVVYEQKNEKLEGVGGLRLQINGQDREFEKNIRTFRGGSFYSLDIPPGRYTLEVDTAQLAYIGAVPRDGILEFTIEATSEGDYLDDLEIYLVPEQPVDDQLKEQPTAEELLTNLSDEYKSMVISLENKIRKALLYYTSAQQFYFRGEFTKALEYIQMSLNLYDTDYGVALKGTIKYMMGDIKAADELWEQAHNRNPNILIPSKKELNQKLNNMYSTSPN